MIEITFDSAALMFENGITEGTILRPPLERDLVELNNVDPKNVLAPGDLDGIDPVIKPPGAGSTTIEACRPIAIIQVCGGGMRLAVQELWSEFVDAPAGPHKGVRAVKPYNPWCNQVRPKWRYRPHLAGMTTDHGPDLVFDFDASQRKNVLLPHAGSLAMYLQTTGRFRYKFALYPDRARQVTPADDDVVLSYPYGGSGAELPMYARVPQGAHALFLRGPAGAETVRIYSGSISDAFDVEIPRNVKVPLADVSALTIYQFPNGVDQPEPCSLHWFISLQ